MDTKTITSFLCEVVRCDYDPFNDKTVEEFTYNGITYAQGRESYYQVLNGMFNDFKACVLHIAVQGKELLNGILADYHKAKKGVYYDIPDEDTIASMKRDARTNNNPSLKQSIKEAYFLNEMVDIQRYFLEEAISFLEGFLKDPCYETDANHNACNKDKEEGIKTVKTTSPQKSDVQVISSIQGLADYLGCGKTLAASIVKSGVLMERGIQYMVGKCWKFNRQNLDEYLKENPQFLSKNRCKP